MCNRLISDKIPKNMRSRKTVVLAADLWTRNHKSGMFNEILNNL